MTYLKFDIKLFLVLFFAFIVMTIIGTLSHELGHYSTARILGYNASINYKSSVHWDSGPENSPGNEVVNPEDDPYTADDFLITLAGPLQTMLTGTIGFLLLLAYKKRFIQKNNIHVMGWILIFLSLFWLREISNLCMAIAGYIKNGSLPLQGDEMRLALYLNMNVWSIQVVTGFIGVLVTGFVVCKMLPQKQILTFLLSGLFGGIAGYYLWLVKYGQYIMP